jgi:oligopeptidase B
VYARGRAALDAPEQVLLDLERARARPRLLRRGRARGEPRRPLLAYAEDTVGRRQYTLRFKDLATGELLPDVIENVEEAVAWAADSAPCSTSRRTRRRCSAAGCASTCSAPIPRRPLVYEEPDDASTLGVSRSKDGRYICSSAREHVSSEQRFADAAIRARVPRDLPAARARTTSTRPSTSTGAGSSAATGRRPISASWRRAGGGRTARSWRELVAHRDDAFMHDFQRVHRVPRDRGALRRPAQGAHPAGRAARTSTSRRTSRPTSWARRQRGGRTATRCATPTRRSPRRHDL